MDDGAPGDDTPEEIPYLQTLYDRPFLLLGLCTVIMLTLYTGWGLWEIMSLPVAALP